MTRTGRLSVLAVLGLLSPLTACSPTYVMRAGWEEARILAARRPIEEVIHDTTTPPTVRAKLRLVEDAREFARAELGLDPDDAFTSYAELDRDTLLLVVSAAPEFRLEWKTWWFPIVGRVPYRGYFNFDKAWREAEKLSRQGFDTWVRPTSAFSTLGWLPDPIVSPTLRSDSITLAETVIHEITHTTFFPRGEARFNESFANFVGHRGAIEFFCDAVADPGRCSAACDRWSDVREFGRFFRSVVEPLEALYASQLPPEAMREEKRRILQKAAVRFREEVQPRLRSGRYADLDPERLNNAWLLSRILYYTRLDDFEAAYRARGNLRATIHAIVKGARERPPWEALDRLLDSGAGGATANLPGGEAERAHPDEAR